MKNFDPSKNGPLRDAGVGNSKSEVDALGKAVRRPGFRIVPPSEYTPLQAALMKAIEESEANRKASVNRAKIAQLFDGDPPYNEHEVRTPHIAN